ncbi:MAG TPA: hypothetical protein VJ206_07470 [bacterium]|nr:hypothetical protein [bacterium]
MAKTTTYLCENPACSLGAVGYPGRFTGGITEAGALMLTGNPDANHGDGICPNCGKPGNKEN